VFSKSTCRKGDVIEPLEIALEDVVHVLPDDVGEGEPVLQGTLDAGVHA
jgi:hypothetical protein